MNMDAKTVKCRTNATNLLLLIPFPVVHYKNSVIYSQRHAQLAYTKKGRYF
jgi:hypothetical protein